MKLTEALDLDSSFSHSPFLGLGCFVSRGLYHSRSIDHWRSAIKGAISRNQAVRFQVFFFAKSFLVSLYLSL